VQDLTGLVIDGYLMLILLWMCPLASLILAKTCQVWVLAPRTDAKQGPVPEEPVPVPSNLRP